MKIDTATLAVFISVLSAVVAAVSLGWNIYRDVLLKARVRVRFAIKTIIQANAPPSAEYIGITAINYGPGSIKLMSIVLIESSFLKRAFRKERYAFLMYDYENPYSGKLPATIDVGEGIDLFLDYDEDCFLKESLTQLGITDSFGRTHWAPKKTMSNLRRKWEAKFGATN